MQKTWVRALLPGLLIGVTGCPDVTVDPGEGVGDMREPAPAVEFDPGNRIIPFPNNLLLDPMTGKVNVPASCGESPASQAIRENVLNQLDGFGTFETAISVTFTEPVDPASLADNVLLYKRVSGTTPIDPADAELVPVITIPGTSVRFDADCMNPSQVPSLTIVPAVPLDERSSYVVALRSGIETADGEAFGPSFTWALVRQETNPVTVDDAGEIVAERTPLDPADPDDRVTLLGLDMLWKAHAQPLAFLRGTGLATDDVLLAWEFRTQTISAPLDPSVAGSPAAIAAMTPRLAVSEYQAGATGPQVMAGLLTAVAGANLCGTLPCDEVGAVLVGQLSAPQFQINTPNPSGGDPVPGPWGDPVMPSPVTADPLGVLITTPATCDAGGCPTVIFGHGLGSQKETMVLIASQLAANGFNAVAIDFVAHGQRAVKISTDGPCAPANVTPAAAPQCFAPFLTPNLGATRDNLRQSVVDLHSLTASLQACGPTNCGLLSVDPNEVLYLGMSLGAIIGSTAVATTPGIKASVLNVGGVGWLDILENTENLTIRCSLVDALIGAGILTGDPSSAGETALCLGDDWKTQPGYRQFSAIARWVLDPADPANFTRQLATKRFLLQEVIGDQVVPNLATENQAALTGLTPMAASCGAPPQPAPSAAITSSPMMTKFVQYTDLTPAMCAPAGNAFVHSSLIAPAPGTAGALGTALMQADAITYLVFNR